MICNTEIREINKRYCKATELRSCSHLRCAILLLVREPRVFCAFNCPCSFLRGKRALRTCCSLAKMRMRSDSPARQSEQFIVRRRASTAVWTSRLPHRRKDANRWRSLPRCRTVCSATPSRPWDLRILSAYSDRELSVDSHMSLYKTVVC